MVSPEEVLSFWLDKVGPKGWYDSDPALDAEITEKFGAAVEAARDGSLGLWLTYPSGTLAYLILTDQFPRNIFRGTAEAFALDPLALTVAKSAIFKGWDLKIDPPARQFFYLPMMHSENLSDQDRCVRLMCDRLPDAPGNLLHAQAHREVIREFGRFPYRNAVLDRQTTKGEEAFAERGGYAHTLRQVQQGVAA